MPTNEIECFGCVESELLYGFARGSPIGGEIHKRGFAM